MPVNWCTSCKVGLANEEVVNGVCERCGSPVVRKMKSQWMLKITEYADKLIDGLDSVDYVEKVKVSQRNWIGRSNGAEVDFSIAGADDKLRIYTTRPDTLFGVTYMVVSPEHPYLDKYKAQISNWDEIVAYREEAAKKSDFERSELAKDKTGVETVSYTHLDVYKRQVQQLNQCLILMTLSNILSYAEEIFGEPFDRDVIITEELRS